MLWLMLMIFSRSIVAIADAVFSYFCGLKFGVILFEVSGVLVTPLPCLLIELAHPVISLV